MSSAISVFFAAMLAGQQASTPTVKVTALADPQIRGFSVVLVLGEMQAGGASQDNVPASARKALADMKDFLPYKSYRLLDTAWMLSSASAHTRLRGPGEYEYEVHINSTDSKLVATQPLKSLMTSKLYIRFALHQTVPAGIASPGTAEMEYAAERHAEAQKRSELAADEIAKLNQDREVLDRQKAELARKLGAKNPEGRKIGRQLEEMSFKIAALKAASVPLSARGAVIDTSFQMDVGETVVVGTSRLKSSDSALIVLLTAVPK